MYKHVHTLVKISVETFSKNPDRSKCWVNELQTIGVLRPLCTMMITVTDQDNLNQRSLPTEPKEWHLLETLCWAAWGSWTLERWELCERISSTATGGFSTSRSDNIIYSVSSKEIRPGMNKLLPKGLNQCIVEFSGAINRSACVCQRGNTRVDLIVCLSGTVALKHHPLKPISPLSFPTSYFTTCLKSCS